MTLDYADASIRAWELATDDDRMNGPSWGDCRGSELEPIARDFSPAVLTGSGMGLSLRVPEWYVLRYVAGRDKLLTKLIRFVGLPFRDLVYSVRASRRRGHVTRAWLPGYMFVEFDVLRDNWGQMLRMPHALGVLGDPSPLPAGLIDDLALRLPDRLAKPSRLSCIAPGIRVRLRDGAFRDHEGPVTWSDRRKVKVMLMLFNCPREVKLDVTDVEIV